MIASGRVSSHRCIRRQHFSFAESLRKLATKARAQRVVSAGTWVEGMIRVDGEDDEVAGRRAEGKSSSVGAPMFSTGRLA